MFEHEIGGHRWQRVPPTEKRGRVHTSTITVAVLGEASAVAVDLDPSDLEWSTCRGSGAGGQHRNVTDSAVQLTHKPSGIQIRVEAERSQHLNKELAKQLLHSRLLEAEEKKVSRKRNAKRREQVGSGMRADKRRTIALQRGTVDDHITGKTMQARKYMKGFMDELWPDGV